MCKHILINQFTKDDLTLLADFADRTHDQCGFGAIIRTKQNELVALKSLSLPALYLTLGGYIERDVISSLVVHHRTSTNHDGLDYAHPFEHKGFYLTHNGVVNVPKTYTTKTKNDSEQLLHHLLDTGFETKSIQGYFSCFIKSEDQTIVLVDATAPIYSDGRVYCSHNLGKGYVKIEKALIVIDPSTHQTISTRPIEVSESRYGMDKAHRSLGQSWDYSSDWSYADDLPRARNAWNEGDPVELLADCLTYNDEEELVNARNDAERRALIQDKAHLLGLKLEKSDEDFLCEMYSE